VEMYWTAKLYQKLGRYAEADPLYKRSLAITEKALGPNHPTVGTPLNNLAAQYRSQIHLHQLRSSILSWHGSLPCCRHLHPAQIECLMPQGHHAIRQLR
jgi:tetratricopeptide (TPR) repeat protein